MMLNGDECQASLFDRSVAFTICASNYLAQASVLGASLAQQHPGMQLVVFLIDNPSDTLNAPPHLMLLHARLALDQSEWSHRQCYYNIMEFATSIKPSCFLYLLENGATRATYFDPDIQLFKPIDFFLDAIPDEEPLVLTPHVLTPLPDDGYLPSDLSIMRAGIYNLGFASVIDSHVTRRLLAWWDRHLHLMCKEDPREGVFTDQKWLDLAPIYFERARIVRHPGCNVAYWNLHERTPRKTKAGWQVDFRDGTTHDLIFFHFSGFVPTDKRLSKHETRFVRRPPGDTTTLLDDYAESLFAAGYHNSSRRRGAKVSFASGAGWDEVCRTLYRQAVSDGIELGDPLATSGFLEWAAESEPGDHLVRYLRTLMKLRPDIAVAYEDGRNVAGLAAWLRNSGVRELGIDPALIDQLGLAVFVDVSSVYFVGYLRGHLGVGEAARSSIAALQAAGVNVVTHDITERNQGPAGDYEVQTLSHPVAKPRIAILGCNADELPRVLLGLPAAIRDTYHIGCWFWETSEFPEEWCNRFDLLDEVWVTTNFIADAVRAKATVPVVVMPLMVNPPQIAVDRSTLVSLLPAVESREFLFLFQFDVASVSFRKNPKGAIKAFIGAFSPQEPVRLIIKLLNGHRDPELVESLRQAAIGQRISFLDLPLDNLERFNLLASIDCFVSLHRAEGFGLSIAEAMAYGRPVVVTNWSGNVDFTSADNAALVAYDLVPTDRAYGPYPVGTVWAEPRLDDAARQMRRVYDDPRWREELGQAGAATIAKKFSPEVVGAAMRGRLQRLSTSARTTMTRGSIGTAAVLPVARTPAPMNVLYQICRITYDALQFPGFYMSRLSRVPPLLRQYGLYGLVHQVAFVIDGRSHIKRRYRLKSHIKRRYRLERLLKTDLLAWLRSLLPAQYRK